MILTLIQETVVPQLVKLSKGISVLTNLQIVPRLVETLNDIQVSNVMTAIPSWMTAALIV